MAKPPTPSPTPNAAAAGANDEPCLRVTAPGGPHWRLGIRFGREPVVLGLDEIEATAKAKSVEPEEVSAMLAADPQLSVVPGWRPARPAPEAPAS